jgi:hypothetical protein
VFLEEDIVDVMIAVRGLIESISINDITFKGCTAYVYSMAPRPNIAKLSGLMLLETVLFNVKKFLEDHTRRVQME